MLSRSNAGWYGPKAGDAVLKVACLCAAAVLLTGCGQVGDPLPPSLQVPLQVQDLRAVQRGGTLIAEFTAPTLATDDAPLRKPVEIDLRIGPEAENWEAGAQRIPAPEQHSQNVRIEAPASEWAGREMILQVRLAGRSGRYGRWSNPVRLRITTPLATPTDVRAEASAGGVRLSWKGTEGASYRIYRKGEKDAAAVLAAESPAPEYVDTAAAYGSKHEYQIQAFMRHGDAESVSERSAAVAITPIDTFAPAVPGGLIVTAGAGAIQLTWDANAEPDLRGYQVYRSVSGGPFEKLGEPSPTPNFTDRASASGTMYRYAVSALDQKGNESARTQPMEIKAP